MAHEVETMAYAGQVPWHGLGVDVPEEATHDPKRMLIAAGLDWQVGLVPLVTIDKQEVVDTRAVRRLSDGAIIGNVGPAFVPVQNEAAFEWFRPFVEVGEASFETAGSLRGGSRVWVLAKLNRDPLVVVPGDNVDKYLLLAHGHDGTLAIRVGFTPIRVVCMNTLRMSLDNGASSQLIKIRHTESAKTNLEAVRETVNAIDAAFKATGEQYKKLAAKGINRADVRRYVKIVFEMPDEDKDLSGQAKRMLNSIEGEILAGDVNLWGAYNGVTSYLTHERGRSNDTRLDALWFGAGANVNKRALETALEMAA